MSSSEKRREMDLIAVRTANESDLPWPLNSIYKYSSENRYPTVIIKIGGKLFIDREGFANLARESRDEQVKRAKAARRGIDYSQARRGTGA